MEGRTIVLVFTCDPVPEELLERIGECMHLEDEDGRRHFGELAKHPEREGWFLLYEAPS